MARNSVKRLFVFGLGYSARFIAARFRAQGWVVEGTTRDGRDETIAFGDGDRVSAAVNVADAILSSAPPDGDGDPVLARYTLPDVWLGYLSSTGVYGDTGGAWVDETAPVGRGRRSARVTADGAWMARGARVFRLPGIYGPGRSPLDRVVAGMAHRVEAPGQVFSRIHVEDIASGVFAALSADRGAYNLADDLPCSQNEVVEHAARLLGIAPPPLVSIESLSPAAQGFYAENRRVANGKAKCVLGWRPLYPDYRTGLRALSATISPNAASSAPDTASGVQR
jgi:hypothetical protein